MRTTEQWLPIDGFPDYVVSSLGQVASIKRGQFKILAGGKTDSGYRNVLLYNAGHRSGHRVHALVATAFHGPRPEGLQIRHLDGDQLNNAATNLVYGTAAENIEDMRRHRGRLLIVGPDPVPWWADRSRVPSPRLPRSVRLRVCVDHDRTDENTYVYPDGRKVCRPCKSAAESESRRRRRAASVSTGRAA